MSQGEAGAKDGAAGWPTLKAEMRLEEFMSRFQESDAAGAQAGDGADGFARDVRTAMVELKAEQRTQRTVLQDLQRQIDLQRLATADLVSRSQSSAAVLEKFEEVAQSTAAAAEQLEAETILVRSCCDATRQATTKEVAAFRVELEESRNKHYADIADICNEFAGKGGAHSGQLRQASSNMSSAETMNMLDARDRTLRDQMTQALEKAQEALSKNFLEEHGHLLRDLLDERETRKHEVQQLRASLESLVTAVQKDGGNSADGKQAGVSTQLTTMREAIGQLRASMDEDGKSSSKQSNNATASTQGESASDAGDQGGTSTGGSSRAATERFVFDSLASLRKDVASCLDAANAAVRLGEHLTNELHIEVDSRCSDVKALREWVCQVLEVSPNAEVYLASDEELRNQNLTSIDDPVSKLRHAGGSPYSGQRDMSAYSLALGAQRKNRGETPTDSSFSGLPDKQIGQSLTALSRPSYSSQTIVTGSGSQNLPMGTAASLDSLGGGASPGLRLSSGNPLTIRQQSMTMPAGDRYLANQRRASQVGQTNAVSSSTNVTSSAASPRQTRVQSPIRNYVVQGGTVQVPDQLRRQGTSPVRDNHRDVLPSSFAAHQATLQAAAAVAAAAGMNSLGAVNAGAPSSAAAMPGLTLDSSRRVASSVQLARSVSPVQRRTTAGA